jgi:hypothetical protein
LSLELAFAQEAEGEILDVAAVHDEDVGGGAR